MKDEMTRKERMLAAMRREPVDRIPTQIDFSPIMLDVMCRHYGVPCRGEHELLAAMDNHLAYAYIDDAFGITRYRNGAGAQFAQDEWGATWDISVEGTFVVKHPLEDLKDYKNYVIPDPNRPGLLDNAERVIARFGKEYVVPSYQVVCIWERYWMMRGLQNAYLDFYEEEDFMNDFLDKITNYQVELAKRYIRAGVDCGRTGDDYGSQNSMLFSPTVWREIIKPRLKRVVDVYKEAGLPVIHHSCGHVLPIISDLIEIGVDVLNNVQPEAMAREDVAKYAGQITLYGGLSTQHTIPQGSREDIFREVADCIEKYNVNNGQLLSPGISITSDVSIERVNILMEAFNELAGARYLIKK